MRAPSEYILNEELEKSIIALMQTLKRGNEKCGKDQVFQLVSNSFEKEIIWTSRTWTILLHRLKEDQSVKLNVAGNRTCLSLPNESQLNKENEQIDGTESKEDKEYQHDIMEKMG